MNQQQADKIGHYRREIIKLNQKVEELTENKRVLETTCIEQHNELNKYRSKIKRMLEIGRE